MIDATRRIGAALLCGAAVTVPLGAQPVGTAFTYQGRLDDGPGRPAGVRPPLRALRRARGRLAGGPPSSGTTSRWGRAVHGHPGLRRGRVRASARFIEVGVRPGASTGAFTVVSPRQTLTPSPFSLRSQTSGAADGLSAACVGCVSDANITSLSGRQGIRLDSRGRAFRREPALHPQLRRGPGRRLQHRR